MFEQEYLIFVLFGDQWQTGNSAGNGNVRRFRRCFLCGSLLYTDKATAMPNSMTVPPFF